MIKILIFAGVLQEPSLKKQVDGITTEENCTIKWNSNWEGKKFPVFLLLNIKEILIYGESFHDGDYGPEEDPYKENDF